MWRHLRSCSPCRARYRSRALLETLEPDGDERARRRLGRAVFAPRPRVRPAFWTLGLALAAAVVLLVVLPRRLLDSGFSPRGGESATGSGGAGLVVFRIPALGRQGQPAERVGAVIRGGDGLAFSYLNPPEVGRHPPDGVRGRRRAAGCTGSGPTGARPTDNPSALPIQASATAVELPEGRAPRSAPRAADPVRAVRPPPLRRPARRGGRWRRGGAARAGLRGLDGDPVERTPGGGAMNPRLALVALALASSLSPAIARAAPPPRAGAGGGDRQQREPDAVAGAPALRRRRRHPERPHAGPCWACARCCWSRPTPRPASCSPRCGPTARPPARRWWPPSIAAPRLARQARARGQATSLYIFIAAHGDADGGPGVPAAGRRATVARRPGRAGPPGGRRPDPRGHRRLPGLGVRGQPRPGRRSLPARLRFLARGARTQLAAAHRAS